MWSLQVFFLSVFNMAETARMLNNSDNEITNQYNTDK